MTFSKLVRFEYQQKIQYGDLIEQDSNGYLVQGLEGDIETGFVAASSPPVHVEKLLCPLEKSPTIPCIGLNYRGHAEAMKLKIPQNPPVFTKPPDALAGPSQDIHVHPEVQNKLDYEGELTVVIGKDAKNVSPENALDFVLGYTMGNDISARDYQIPDVCGYQVGYAKSFDAFGPVGPAIWAARHVPDPQKLHYVTRVNGEVRQDIQTSDMIFSVRQIIAHLSRGTTLRAGTAIMTGTDMGIGWDNENFLKDGDVVEVELDGLPPLVNRIVFDRAP